MDNNACNITLGNLKSLQCFMEIRVLKKTLAKIFWPVS